MAELGNNVADASTAVDQKTLDYDALAEVFSYLSAKNLTRLQLVSKPIMNMITSDPFFILMQSYHTSTAAAAIFAYGHSRSRPQIFLLDHDAGLPSGSLDALSNYDNRFLYSAGGLVFYRKRDGISYSICAFNPARRKSSLIPVPPGDGNALPASLAVDFTNDGDYKLVYLTSDRNWSSLYQCRVYDSAARVWTRDEMIHHGSRQLKFHNPVVHRGAVFWATDCFRHTTADPYVMSYEIATGAIEFLAMPDGSAVESEDRISVAVWEESWLCLVHHSKSSGAFTLWRWSEESHSWAKSSNEFVYWEKPEAVVGSMLVCNGGREKGMLLVFSVEDEAYVYSFKLRDLTKLATNMGSYFPKFTAYANTLRPACGGQEAD
ncbi:uncharacterized protein LOC121984321 [Zingiber officinale]|uniref:uncharacterized protein LOC121984321 n=1 Tax=Zingiber officinale TaxID=94328 RepID=UPI001C4C310E|nr:uncharacterized protein LOC121984321 [Zingiber officinale]